MSEPVLMGHFADADIPWLLDPWPRALRRARFALITCIDSHRDVAKLDTLRGFLTQAGHNHEPLGEALAVERAAVQAMLASDNYFTGFDELWLFERRPALPPPDRVDLTSDILDQPPPGLDRWMDRSSCLLGIGDGDGLSYVTTDPHIEEEIAAAGF